MEGAGAAFASLSVSVIYNTKLNTVYWQYEVTLACSHCVCAGSHQVCWFPSTVQRRALD